MSLSTPRSSSQAVRGATSRTTTAHNHFGNRSLNPPLHSDGEEGPTGLAQRLATAGRGGNGSYPFPSHRQALTPTAANALPGVVHNWANSRTAGADAADGFAVNERRRAGDAL